MGGTVRASPLVTVGLRVLNGDSYLLQALESVLAQDFDDFELIISDNASNDRTPAISIGSRGRAG